MRAEWMVLALVGVLGCGFEPEGAEAFTPPEQYKGWWRETEACSGREGDFYSVKWASIPGRTFDCPSGTCVGRWEPGQRIFLAEAYKYNEMVVRHEMLHAILTRAGHPDPPFGQGCPLTWDTWRSVHGSDPPIVID